MRNASLRESLSADPFLDNLPSMNIATGVYPAKIVSSVARIIRRRRLGLAIAEVVTEHHVLMSCLWAVRCGAEDHESSAGLQMIEIVVLRDTLVGGRSYDDDAGARGA